MCPSSLLHNLFPAALRLRVHALDLGDGLTVTLASAGPGASCPDCRAKSTRVHSRYPRSP